MDDDRVIRRPLLELEDAAHRRRVLRVRAQAIDRFRREYDELAVTQRGDSGFKFYEGGSNDTDHMAGDCTGKLEQA